MADLAKVMGLDVAAGGPTIIRKTADEIVNNSIALQADDHLILPVSANEVWAFDLYLYHLPVATTKGIRFNFTVPAGAVGVYHLASLAADASSVTYINAFTTTGYIYRVPAAGRMACIHCLIVNGGNAGNVVFRWAQGVAWAADTKVLANSCIIAHQLV